MRDNAIDALGASHAYKAGSAHTTAQTVVAAQATGLKIRVKAFRIVAANANATDAATNDLWLSDGASTALLGLVSIPIIDSQANTNITPWYDSGIVILPGFGVAGTAATALTIDATATDANLKFQLDVWYDVINATGDVQ